MRFNGSQASSEQNQFLCQIKTELDRVEALNRQPSNNPWPTHIFAAILERTWPSNFEYGFPLVEVQQKISRLLAYCPEENELNNLLDLAFKFTDKIQTIDKETWVANLLVESDSKLFTPAFLDRLYPLMQNAQLNPNKIFQTIMATDCQTILKEKPELKKFLEHYFFLLSFKFDITLNALPRNQQNLYQQLKEECRVITFANDMRLHGRQFMDRINIAINEVRSSLSIDSAISDEFMQKIMTAFASQAKHSTLVQHAEEEYSRNDSPSSMKLN